MQITYLKPANIIQPIFGYNCNVFKRKPIVLLPKQERWRKAAKLINLSHQGCMRLEWIIFYCTAGNQNVSLTCKHFNISRKCFYKWYNRFFESRENVWSLETRSTIPRNRRKPEITINQEIRVKQLREKYMYWGKEKLKIIYQKTYQETISTNKIQKIINKHHLYPDKTKHCKLIIKRKKKKPKKRIQELVKEPALWFLLQLDGITIYWGGLKRYIFTAVDHTGKFGYARMYNNKSSKSAADFLYRLKYVINQPIINLQTDNGSEFAGLFEKAAQILKIERYFSRVRTPKDNSEIERFNQTLEYEWLNDGNFNPNCKEFNKALTEWLTTYNFKRPHQTLGYLTPIEYIVKNTKVLPMYPARTEI